MDLNQARRLLAGDRYSVVANSLQLHVHTQRRGDESQVTCTRQVTRRGASCLGARVRPP